MTDKKALVIFSGGQDSTTCLVQAIKQYGIENERQLVLIMGSVIQLN